MPTTCGTRHAIDFLALGEFFGKKNSVSAPFSFPDLRKQPISPLERHNELPTREAKKSNSRKVSQTSHPVSWTGKASPIRGSS